MSSSSDQQGDSDDVPEKIKQNGLGSNNESHHFSEPENGTLSENSFGTPYQLPSTSARNEGVEDGYDCEGIDVECRYCHYRLTNVGEKKYPRVVFCGDCGWNSVEPAKLSRHSRSRHPLDSPTYYCQHCEYRVDHPTSWTGDDRPYECGECDYRARTSTALNYHLRAKHSDERPYKCPHCSYAGVQSSSLKSHMMTRHNAGQKNIVCPSCDFRASIPSVMRKHLERKHHGGSRTRTTPRMRSSSRINPTTPIPEQPTIDLRAHRVLTDLLSQTPRLTIPDPPKSIDLPQLNTHNNKPDVADYLQMPSFGLFEAIYESQGLTPEKIISPTNKKSDVIIIDD